MSEGAMSEGAMSETWHQWLTTDTPHSRGQARLAQLYLGWLNFRANPLAMVGLGIIVALVVVAAFAPWIAPHDHFAQDLTARLTPPGEGGHLLGADELGRDIYSRILYGSRITLYIVALVTVTAPLIGLLVGTAAGYFGGWVDIVLMRLTDIFLAFPRLVLALAFVAALGAGIENAVLAITLTAWPPYARFARAETLTIRKSNYIAAIQLQGAQPPLPEWGAMISSGRKFILDHWWVATMPGLAIFTVSLGFNLLGDGLRDVFDPKRGSQ